MNLLDLIGNTPLLHLEDIFQGKKINVYAKAEWRNPGGSLKDRAESPPTPGAAPPVEAATRPVV